MEKKVKCWEFFECNKEQCPAYKSKELGCWLVSGTHCRDEIQGKFLEKIEMCLDCEPFKKNVDIASLEETLKVVNEQFTEFRRMVDERDMELEGISMELALGLSEVFEALKQISSGDPLVRIPETSELELITKLKHMVNLTAENLAEIVDLSHEFAIGLAEHFDALHRVSTGDLTARVSGISQVELLESLKKVTNEMIESVSREMAERKRAEETLRESEERFRDIAYSMADWIWEVDRNGVYTYCSERVVDILGYYPEEIIGKTPFDLMPEDEAKRVGEIFSKIAQMKGPIKDLENWNIKKNGKLVCFLTNGVPLLDEQGNLEGYRGVDKDITERKRAEEALKEYSHELEVKVEQRTRELRETHEQLVRQEKLGVIGQLAGGVGHELRNPLGAIKNAAYLLNMALEDPEPEVKETLEIIEKEVGTSERVITSLLDFTRPKPPTRLKIDINDIVQAALSRRPVPDNVEVVSQLDEALPAILADSTQLDRVYRNLIRNAIQAMPEGGCLAVRSEAPSPEWVAVSFSDTGVGIDEETLGKVFEPLFTTKAKGIGLGLALTKMLIEAHGGTIEVQSRVGEGSTFTVKLPVG